MSSKWLVVVLAIAACTDEATIADQVCGNDVLDPGEDCDRPGAMCTADCRIACVPQQACQKATPTPSLIDCPEPFLTSATVACTSADAIDGTCCPTAMKCGTDRICHAPSGTVPASALAIPYDVQTFVAADLDGDMITDVLGASENAVEARYGATTSPLTSVVDSAAPAPTTSTTQVAFADFDGDLRVDAVIPTLAGVFAFDTATGVPTQVAFPVAGSSASGAPSGVVPGVTHLQLGAGTVANVISGIVEFDYVPNPLTGQSKTQLNLISTPAVFTAQAQFVPADGDAKPCNVTGHSLPRGHALHPFIDDKTIRVPVELGGTSATSPQVCVSTVDPSAAGAGASYSVNTTELATVTPAGHTLAIAASNSSGELFFANYFAASGACPDLVVSVLDSATAAAPSIPSTLILKGTGTANTNACAIDKAHAGTLVAGAPLAPIVLSLSVPRAALITTKGIYAFNGVGFDASPATPATRAWSYAVVGDLDGDGLDDFAAMSTGQDVEVFRQHASALVPQWTDVVIPTGDNVASIALGNFDGDKAGDVAIMTMDNSLGITPVPQDLTIAWGSVDGTFSAQSYGSFAEPRAMVATNLLDTSVPLGLDECDDLMIARGGNDPTNVDDPALLIAQYGSPARVLSAPFVYSAYFNGMSQPPAIGVPIAAVTGRFAANNSEAVFAFFEQQGATQAADGSIVTALDALIYTPTAATFLPSTASIQPTCAGPILGSNDIPFCLTQTDFFTMRRDTAGDVLIAARRDADGDARTECMEYFVANGGAPNLQSIACSDLAPAAASSSVPDIAAAYNALTGVSRVAVIDDDGTTEHVTISTPAAGMHAYNTFLWELTIDATGRPQFANPVELDSELEASGILPAGATANCFGATSMELGARSLNGMTYGAVTDEIVVGCSMLGVGPTPTTYDSQFFARFTDPGGGPPHYELLYDMQVDASPSVVRGDVDGDGLDDLLLESGPLGTGARLLRVLHQCDMHETTCGGS